MEPHPDAGADAPPARISPYAGRSVLGRSTRTRDTRTAASPASPAGLRAATGGTAAADDSAGGALTGPWDQAFWFFLAGQVRSKSNFRVSRSGRGSQTAPADEWAALAAFETRVHAAARRHRPSGWDLGDKSARLVHRPVAVTVCLARSLLDTGNIDKSVLDGLQGVAVHNDAQVAWSTSANIRSSRSPGLLVAVARLAPGADLHAQLEAGQQLAAFAVELSAGTLL